MHANVQRCLARLADACNRRGWDVGDLWARGLDRIEQRYSVKVFLAGFALEGMEEETPEMTIILRGQPEF